MDLNQPYVHCGVCHIDAKTNKKLYLTSCAHILCSSHLNIDESSLKFITNVEQIKITCLVCKNENISILEINEYLPSELKMYLKPFPKQIETFFANAQFQFIGMIEKLQYLQDSLDKLTKKNTNLRDLLKQAKYEIAIVDELKLNNKLIKNENSKLANEVSELKKLLSGNVNNKVVDLTVCSTTSTNSSSDNNNSNNHNLSQISLDELIQSQNKSAKRKGNYDHESFVNKIQKFSSLKKLPIQAESTSIKSMINNNSLPLSSRSGDENANHRNNYSINNNMNKSTNSNSNNNNDNNSFSRSLSTSSFKPTSITNTTGMGTKGSNNIRRLSLRPPTQTNATSIASNRVLSTGGRFNLLSSNSRVSGGMNYLNRGNSATLKSSHFFKK